jgi:hypothetical protein
LGYFGIRTVEIAVLYSSETFVLTARLHGVIKVKVKFSLELAMKARRRSRGIAVLFL